MGTPLRKMASRPNIGTFLVEREGERRERLTTFKQTPHMPWFFHTINKSTFFIQVAYLIKSVHVHSNMYRSLLTENSLDFTCTCKHTHTQLHTFKLIAAVRPKLNMPILRKSLSHKESNVFMVENCCCCVLPTCKQSREKHLFLVWPSCIFKCRTGFIDARFVEFHHLVWGCNPSSWRLNINSNQTTSWWVRNVSKVSVWACICKNNLNVKCLKRKITAGEFRNIPSNCFSILLHSISGTHGSVIQTFLSVLLWLTAHLVNTLILRLLFSE